MQLCVIRGGLTKKVILDLNPREGAMWTPSWQRECPVQRS